MAADLRETQENQGVSENRIDKPGIMDTNFSRKLRKELSTEEKEHIRQIIAELKGGAANG